MCPDLLGPYLVDLLDQPAALTRTLSKLRTSSLPAKLRQDLASDRFSRIICTGMGSSCHALYPLHRKLLKEGWGSHWLETSELLGDFEQLLNEKTLLIVASQSGESAEVKGLMALVDRVGYCIGITNNAESHLGKACHLRFTLDAGYESTVSCKTYLSTLAVVSWLMEKITRPDSDTVLQKIEGMIPPLSDYLSDWQEHVVFLMSYLAEIRTIFVTGRGASLANAGTSGLILKESTRLPAEGMSSAAFRHGPLEMCDDSVLVLVFEGQGTDKLLNQNLVKDIRRLGGRAELLSPTASELPFRIPHMTFDDCPLLEILPVQMVSLARAALHGHQPGLFERAQKITTIS